MSKITKGDVFILRLDYANDCIGLRAKQDMEVIDLLNCFVRYASGGKEVFEFKITEGNFEELIRWIEHNPDGQKMCEIVAIPNYILDGFTMCTMVVT